MLLDYQAKIQENHEIKLRLLQKENLENDYRIEIDSLMEELDTKGKRIKNLETLKKSPATAPDTSEKDLQIESLQDQIAVLKTEVCLLQKQLETAMSAEPVDSWNNTIREELSNLQVRHSIFLYFMLITFYLLVSE